MMDTINSFSVEEVERNTIAVAKRDSQGMLNLADIDQAITRREKALNTNRSKASFSVSYNNSGSRL